MLNIGFKVENLTRDRGTIRELLSYFKHNHQYLLEIGFCHDNPSMNAFFQSVCKDELHRIITHNRHKNSVISLYQREEKMLEELSISKSLNSQYSIIHLTESKEVESLFTEKDLIFKGIPLLEKLNRIAVEHNFAYYLENTYHGIDFYKELFDLMGRKELQNIHFCFDIGHAKVWSYNTLAEWYQFLHYLKKTGVKLHFHLHLNDGSADEHLSFMEANHTGGDMFSGYIHYENVMRSLIYQFPHERKIFEVKPKFAIPNIQYIARLLSRERVAS